MHRDLKPGNIKIKPDGTVKVLDFGLAKMGGTPTAHSDNSPTVSMSQTAAGVILGTASYMSPEQAKGKPVDKRADIYAFGAVLYEMLTGQRLHQGETTTEVLASVIKEDPRWEEVVPQAQRLLRRCLEKDPQKRLRHIGDVMALVDDAPAAPVSTAQPARGSRWVRPALMAVAVMLVALAGWALWRARRPAQPVESVRFQIQSPVRSSGYQGVSPDGRQLSFLGVGPNGQSAVWLRSVNALESRPLAGTDGADGLPFWSPDSRSLAFWSSNKLRKVDIAGGPAQVICDSSTVLGGFWTHDNKIVFGTTAGVMQVPGEGGMAAPLTTVDSSLGEQVHLLPSLLPDGRHFTYVRTGSVDGTYLGSLDAKPEQQSAKPILPGALGMYSPVPGATMGYLLFVRDSSLMAQPFDSGRLELSGAAVPIAERVAYFGSSENGVLAYQNGAGPFIGQFVNRELTWVNRQGKVLGTAAEPALHNSIALSPDGTRVATARLESNPGQPNLDVWLTDFARVSSTRFTFFAGLDGVPIWSPDGSRIVFSSSRSGPSDLYFKASNSAGNDELLLHSNEIKFATDWSRDGRYLLYTNQSVKTGLDVWVLPGMNGAAGDRKPEPFLQTEFNESGGQFSPDVRWVAYTSNESGSPEVYVQPFPANSGGGGKWQVSKGGGSLPRWRRDGKELFYLAQDNKLMAMDVATTQVFKAGIPQPLFDTHVVRSPVDQFIYDVTADGKKFLVVTAAGNDAPSPVTVVLNWQVALKK